MKLYLATFSDEDGTEIVGLFETEERAQKEIDFVKKKKWNFYKRDGIEEVIVGQNIFLQEEEDETLY